MSEIHVERSFEDLSGAARHLGFMDGLYGLPKQNPYSETSDYSISAEQLKILEQDYDAGYILGTDKAKLQKDEPLK